MKKELLDIPFFGTAVKIMDHYFVSRDGSFSDRREVVKIIKKIKKGKIIFIAPEGTRNPEKGLLDFKDGESLESAELLAQAHYNLGISYAKKELFNQAEQEILTAISIIPNPEYRNVLQMVRQQIKEEVNK